MIEIVFLFVFIELHIVHIIWTMYLLVHTYKDYLNKLKIYDVVFLATLLLGLFVTLSKRMLSHLIGNNL